MVYDPNYNYDEDDNANGANENVEDDDEDEDNDEYSDDDDMSWKVRRSAAKCLEAIISTRHELLAEFFKILSPALIARFKGGYTLATFIPIDNCFIFFRKRRKCEIRHFQRIHRSPKTNTFYR